MTGVSERLDAIEARLGAATPGPWKADTGVRGDCVVWGPNGRFLMNMQAEPHWLEYHGETRMVSFDVDRRDAEFIAAAPTDIAFLLVLARKQQAATDAVRAIHREIECQDEDGEPTGGTACEECKDLDDHSGERVHEVYPCLTVRDITKALAGEQTFAGMRDKIKANEEGK